MSTTYTGLVFFGAFVERESPLGQRLDEYVEKFGGTYAPTEVPGVEIGYVSSDRGAWMVVRAKGSGLSFSRYDNAEAPRTLTEDSAWRPAIWAFWEQIKAEAPTPAIGWHFACDVS